MERYTKFVFEAGEGVILETEKGTKGELIVKAHKQGSHTDGHVKCANPPIPQGYRHSWGEWYNGYTIQRNSDSSEFTWIPVEVLEANGTLDNGKKFNSRFGRRNFQDEIISEDGYFEPMTEELKAQRQSVEKYGGFYISTYEISFDFVEKVAIPRSIYYKTPCTNISLNRSKRIAARIEDTEEVKSHLTYGAEYDTALEWFIESKARSFWEVVGSSKDWGNYITSHSYPVILETGRYDSATNGICDFAGNLREWTQEMLMFDDGRGVVRGGSYLDDPRKYPACCRTPVLKDARATYEDTGFRAALWIA